MSNLTDSAHIHVQVNRDLHTRALRLIPWGTRSEMFRKILEIILDAIESSGTIMIGAIMSGDIRIVYQEKANETRGYSDPGGQDEPQ